MARQLWELDELKKKLDVPLLLAGDIFDRPDNPSELVNFVISNLPHGYAIPGQHDLRHHRYKDIAKTSYWTLVEAGVLVNLEPGKVIEHGGTIPIRLHGFPWGFPVKPLDNPCDLALDVAVVHAYCWKGKAYPGALLEQNANEWNERLKGFDLGIFGDNHLPFEYGKVWNCGGFFRRRIDEQEHMPSIGLIMSDSTVERHYLNCSKDVFLTTEGTAKEETDFTGFVQELEGLADQLLHFGESVRRALDGMKASEELRRAVEELLL